MSRELAERCVQLLAASCTANGGSVGTLDLTGGAPELTPQFRWGGGPCSWSVRLPSVTQLLHCPACAFGQSAPLLVQPVCPASWLGAAGWATASVLCDLPTVAAPAVPRALSLQVSGSGGTAVGGGGD